MNLRKQVSGKEIQNGSKGKTNKSRRRINKDNQLYNSTVSIKESKTAISKADNKSYCNENKKRGFDV